MDSDYCPDPDWCPAAPDPHGHRTDDTYFYRRADSDAGPGCDTNADDDRPLLRPLGNEPAAAGAPVALDGPDPGDAEG